MKTIHLPRKWPLRILAAAFWFVSSGLALHGQVPGLKQILEGSTPAKTSTADGAQDPKKRLETWRQEARDVLARFEAAGTSVALPEGITDAELDDRRRDLEQMIQITTAALKNASAIEEARKAAEAARIQDADWSGFKESPPYSILMVDELLNERDAVKSKLTSHDASLTNLEGLLNSVITEAKAAEEAVNVAMAAVQGAGEGKADAPKWRLDASRAKARLLAVRAGYIQANVESTRERIAASKAELTLIERKVKTAAPNSRFSEEDLAKVGKISDERKKAAEKEILAVSRRLKAAITTRTQAQEALEALLATATDGKEPEGVELARFRLEVADSRIKSLESMIEALESIVQLENVLWKAYQDRRTIVTAGTSQERAKALASIVTLSERLRAWLNVVENDMTTTGADLSKIESRAASITNEDPRFPLINEQRAACSEELAMVQRAYQAVSAQRKIFRRWVADYSPKPGEAGFFERSTAAIGKAWDTVKRIWSFEVMSFEDKLEVDGQTITGKIPITLGTLLRAILFFIIGYWITSHVANRLQRTLVTRGHIAEPQAKTLRNWAMIVVGVFLVIGTLSFLKIPLTVFAFFGGALAIGIGFGTQTLIKNFISGIIVLAERKIRVGDILDVDGIVGTVIEVNTRSSVIRGADDVETMIPNSLFLENRVTNWTLSSNKVRRNLRVGVAYGTSPQTVMEILTDCAGRHGLICKSPAPFSTFDDFGDNALIFSLYFWVEMGGGTNAMIVTSDLRLMIEKRFTEAGVGVPYPQRDMHLTTDKPIQVEIALPAAPPAP